MKKFWWELIFALFCLTAALEALRIAGITFADWEWWVIIAGFSAWNSLLDYFLEDWKKWRRNDKRTD